MSIRYKENLDILEELKKKGYTTYIIRQQHLLSDATLQHIRNGEAISFDSLNKLCELLNCKVEDIIEYVPD